MDRCDTFRDCRTTIPLIGCVNYARFPKSGHIYGICAHIATDTKMPISGPLLKDSLNEGHTVDLTSL